jgi:hypothetical protein
VGMISREQDVILRDAMIAYGPLYLLCSGGAIASLSTALLFRIAHQISSSPMISNLTGEIASQPVAPRAVPLYLFGLVGVALALVTRPHRRLWSAQVWWRLPWEWVAGALAFGLFAKVTMTPAGTPWSVGHIVPFLFIGLSATLVWSGVYGWALSVMVRRLWQETAEATVRHVSSYLGIRQSDLSQVQADPVSKEIAIHGPFSDTDGQRLQMGLLALIPHVRAVGVSMSVAGRLSHSSQSRAFREFTRVAVEAAAQRKARRELQEPAGSSMTAIAPWLEVRRRRRNPVFTVCVAVASLLLVWVLWELGLLNPVRPAEMERDLESFFGSHFIHSVDGTR